MTAVVMRAALNGVRTPLQIFLTVSFCPNFCPS
jgi:hypothetical protein